MSTHDARVVEGLDECEVWVCGEGRGGLRVLADGGFGKYRDAVAAEVEARASRAAAAANERRRVAKGRGEKRRDGQAPSR